MKTIILLTFFLSAISVIGQDITTSRLNWQITQIEDGNTGDKRPSSDIIESEGSTIIWKDGYGNIKRSFTILQTNGAWHTVLSPGSILYEIAEGSIPGTIQFSRINAALYIKLIVLIGELPEVKDFLVSDVTKL